MKPKLEHHVVIFIIACILSSGYIVGCFKTAGISGPTVEQLSDAAKKQKSSTEVIDKEASSIQKTSNEDHSKESAGKIKEANVNLKNNIEVLSKEAQAKDALEKRLEEADNRIKELEEEDNKFTEWVCKIAIVAGMFLTAIGIVIFIKTGFTQWEVGALGIALTLTSGITTWFFANIIWFVIGIGVIALLGVLLWVFLRTDKTAEAAVQVSEMLKHEIKTLNKIEFSNINEKEEYVKYDEVKGILTKIFGDNVHHGQAGSIQTEGVYNHITAKRKKIINRAKSFYN